VEINLTESGVHPITLGEFLDLSGTDPGVLLEIDLNYPHVEGIPALRKAIAALYDARPEQVLVTVGAIEANHILTRTLVGPGAGIAVMLPNYLQIWGLARNDGADLATFRLDPEREWALDLDGLEAAVGPGTRMIAVCNPNNPTGRALTGAEMDRVLEVAERSGSWLLSDEVYRGVERVGDAETPSFWGRSDRVVAVGSMSKAYGMPGLRLGWAVAPEGVVQDIWRRHEYTTLSASMLANHLAAIALQPAVRARLLERARGLIRSGFPVLEEWAGSHPGLLSLRPPDAAAIAFVRYETGEASVDLVERIRREQSVLVAPGAHFGVEGHLRISFGLPHDYLAEGLRRIAAVLTGG
jgi:aspartate/methionine/tyrosine aminotransferase